MHLNMFVEMIAHNKFDHRAFRLLVKSIQFVCQNLHHHITSSEVRGLVMKVIVIVIMSVHISI